MKNDHLQLPEAYQESLKNWKKKYRVKYLELGGQDVEQTDKDAIALVPKHKFGKLIFFRMPTRQEMAAAENLAVDPETGRFDVYKKAEKLILDCHLGGDYTLQEIYEDVELFMDASNFILYRLIESKNANWGSC